MPLDQTNWKQDTETKPDVFSLEGLIAWLERQPPQQSYCWMGGGECLYAAYGRNLGIKYSEVVNKIKEYHGELHGAEPMFGRPYPVLSMDKPHIFGAALSRARTLLAETHK